MKEKVCPKCALSKTTDAFYKTGRTTSSWCKDCVRAKSKEQRANGYKTKYRPSTEEQKARRRVRDGVVSPRQRYKLSGIQRAAYQAWSNIKKRTLRNGVDLVITREWVEAEFTEFCNTHYYELGSKSPFQPSIDRIDPSKTYSIENCRVVWLIENYARNTFSDEQLIEFCKRKLNLPVE